SSATTVCQLQEQSTKRQSKRWGCTKLTTRTIFKPTRATSRVWLAANAKRFAKARSEAKPGRHRDGCFAVAVRLSLWAGPLTNATLKSSRSASALAALIRLIVPPEAFYYRGFMFDTSFQHNGQDALLAGVALPTFKVELETSKGKVLGTSFGKEVTVERLPISKGIAGVSMQLEPGVMRELHWHATAAEWAFVLKG